MNYTIGVSESGKFIRLRVEGEISAELARKWSDEMREMGLASGIGRFLSDVRGARNVSSILENYSFAYKDAPELSLDRNARVAILASPDDRSHDFVEVTLQNAGYNVRLFRDESSAVQWLEED